MPGPLATIWTFPKTGSAAVVFTNGRGLGDASDFVAQILIQEMFDHPWYNCSRHGCSENTHIARSFTTNLINIHAKASSSKQSIQIDISSQEGQHTSFMVEFCKDSEYADKWKRTGFLVEYHIEYPREQGPGHGVHVLDQEVA